MKIFRVVNASRDEEAYILRKAKEHLDFCKDKQDTARRALVEAETATKKAKEKYEQLFIQTEENERLRRKKEADTKLF